MPDNLHTKLAHIMGEMGGMNREGRNPHFKYEFFTADQVAARVRSLLSEHNIAFSAEMVNRELVTIDMVTNSGELRKSYRWVVDFRFTFYDGDSAETLSCLWTSEAPANDDKGLNKAATAAVKYFLLKTFIVGASDEPDSDAEGLTPAQLRAAQEVTPQAGTITYTYTPLAGDDIELPPAVNPKVRRQTRQKLNELTPKAYELATRLRERAAEHGISSEEILEALGVKSSVEWQWEDGGYELAWEKLYEKFADRIDK